MKIVEGIVAVGEIACHQTTRTKNEMVAVAFVVLEPTHRETV